jgi:hypothetical protein
MDTVQKGKMAVVTLWALAVILFVWIFLPSAGEWAKPQASEASVEKLTGQYGDFSILLGSNEKTAYVGIGVKSPEVFLKAVKDAVDLTEKKTGRKVISMSGGTSLADVVFHLEEPKSSK